MKYIHPIASLKQYYLFLKMKTFTRNSLKPDSICDVFA